MTVHRMRWCIILLVATVLSQWTSAVVASEWKHPLQKQGRLGSPLVEVTPFVFNDRLYLLENNQKFWDIGGKPGDRFHEDEVRIRDVETGRLVSVALRGCGFGTALVDNGRVYVFAGDFGKDKPWRQITEIVMTSSDDLVNWTKPVVVLRATEQDGYFWNTAVARGPKGYVLLVETSDVRFPPFTFRYLESDDLINWRSIPEAIYGRDKYVGGPALYYEGGWWYTLYLQNIGHGWETRITRSKDLIHWQDAPEGRPFLTFNREHRNIPLLDPQVRENNASDAEVAYFRGKTIVYFTGSDQSTAGDLQWATFDGTPRELFETFFEGVDPSTSSTTDESLLAAEQVMRLVDKTHTVHDASIINLRDGTRVHSPMGFAVSVSDTVPPEHAGDWTPVLIAPRAGTTTKATDAAVSVRRVPTPQQLAYQNDQLGAFVHFGPATYINSDMLSTPDPSVFNPVNLDAEQWVLAAKSFGAKHIVLTSKHHNGFCLWPTKTTNYSVKSSPWKNGKGDVVREFAEACRKHGMKLGLYVSGGDKHFGCHSTPDPMGERKIIGNRNAYFLIFMEQLKELLTNYGEISVVWFDGAYDPFGWDVMDASGRRLGTAHGDAIAAFVHALQPNAVIFGGTQPDVRWSGSEQGWAPYPLWNVVEPGEGTKQWVSPTNAGWILAEANIHTRDTWFWSPNSDHTLRSVDYLMQAYYNSIGRGGNLLVNLTPDTTGRIPEAEVKRLKEFGDALKRHFGKPLATTDSLGGWTEPGVLVLKLLQVSRVDHVVLEEDIARGQHVRAYAIDALVDGQWRQIAAGESIGRRRIEKLNPVMTQQLRLRITQSEGLPAIRAMSAYRTAE